MRDDDEITPAGVIVTGFRWLPVIIIAGVLLTLGITALCLFVWHVDGAFQKAGIQRTYTNTVQSQAYQDSLLAQMQQHLANISGPGGLAATRASLPHGSAEQQVVQSQELNELDQFCTESLRFVPQTEGPAGQQLQTVITANCTAGVPVASPPLAPAP